MNSGKPNFSTAFELMDDELINAEKRLHRKRTKSNKETEATPKQPTGANQDEDGIKKKWSIDVDAFDSKEFNFVELTSDSRQKSRRSITLKVLEENEFRFNHLYHQIQLRGDSINKQDLADQALCLLFEKYGLITPAAKK